MLPGASPGSAGVYPPVFPPSLRPKPGVAQGTSSLEFRTPHKHKHEHKMSWPLPPHGSSFVCQAGNLTPPLLPWPLAAHSNSRPRLSTCFLSAKVGPGHQSSMPTAPERQTHLEHVWLSWGCGSRLILLLISPSPRALVPPSSCTHTSLPSLPCHGFSPSHRDAGCICGSSPIINKTYIYTVCSV